MSGGHYNYAYLKIDELAESILADVKIDSIESPLMSDSTRKMLRLFAIDLASIANKAKAVEWFMSGDYNENDLVEAFIDKTIFDGVYYGKDGKE